MNSPRVSNPCEKKVQKRVSFPLPFSVCFKAESQKKPQDFCHQMCCGSATNTLILRQRDGIVLWLAAEVRLRVVRQRELAADDIFVGEPHTQALSGGTLISHHKLWSN